MCVCLYCNGTINVCSAFYSEFASTSDPITHNLSSDSSRIFTWGISRFLAIVCEGAARVECTGEALLRVAQTADALGRAGDETLGTGVSRGFPVGSNGAFASLFDDELMILCIFNVFRVFNIVQRVL